MGLAIDAKGSGVIEGVCKGCSLAVFYRLVDTKLRYHNIMTKFDCSCGVNVGFTVSTTLKFNSWGIKRNGWIPYADPPPSVSPPTDLSVDPSVKKRVKSLASPV